MKSKKDINPNEGQDMRILKCVNIAYDGFVGCCYQNRKDAENDKSNEIKTHGAKTNKDECTSEKRDDDQVKTKWIKNKKGDNCGTYRVYESKGSIYHRGGHKTIDEVIDAKESGENCNKKLAFGGSMESTDMDSNVDENKVREVKYEKKAFERNVKFAKINSSSNIRAISYCYKNRTSDEKDKYRGKGVGSRMTIIFSNEIKKDYSIERAMTEVASDVMKMQKGMNNVRCYYQCGTKVSIWTLKRSV
ncbi:25710_t:CDS:2, partial [Gigaspora margarita]